MLFVSTGRSKWMAEMDADGAGGNPVGGIGGVAPDPLTGGINPAAEHGIPNGIGGALAVVEPDHWVDVIIAVRSVGVGAGAYPSGGKRGGVGESALTGVGGIWRYQIIEWAYGETISKGMAFGGEGGNDSGATGPNGNALGSGVLRKQNQSQSGDEFAGGCCYPKTSIHSVC